MPSNRELVEKTFDTASFLNGGELNPTQQDRFITLVKQFSVLLGQVRFIPMPTPQYTVDKMHISEPVTEAIEENTTSANLAEGRFNQVTLQAVKLRSAWNITTEALQSNIERDDFEDTLFQRMTERIATDLELLAIQGDTTIVGTDPRARLLRRLDGWDIQSAGAHIIDAAAETIEKNMFAQALRTMPKQYRNDPGLRWLMSDTLATDWMNLLAERGTAVGDSALQGVGLNPFGKPMIQVPLIPDDKPLVLADATPAYTVGVRSGPFEVVTGSNDQFTITDALATAVAVTVPAGTWDTVTVAASINAQMIAGGITLIVCSDDGDGQLKFETTDTGVAATFTLAAGANDFLVTAGVTPAVYTGAAAGTGGTVDEGSFIILTNPLNMIFGMLDGTRVFSEFNKDYDRIETVVFNQVDAKIENIDALVKVINVRRQQL